MHVSKRLPLPAAVPFCCLPGLLCIVANLSADTPKQVRNGKSGDVPEIRIPAARRATWVASRPGLCRRIICGAAAAIAGTGLKLEHCLLMP